MKTLTRNTAASPVAKSGHTPPAGTPLREPQRISDFLILPEFKALLPELDDEESRRLKKQLKEEGVLSPLVTAEVDGTAVLLDGHNRCEFITEMKIEDYSITHLGPMTKAAAMEWMVQNQLGRRNLQPFAKFQALEGLIPQIKAIAKANQTGGVEVQKSVHLDSTLARLVGVGKTTVKKMRALSAGGASEEDQASLRAGTRSVDEVYRKFREQSQPNTGTPTPGAQKLDKTAIRTVRLADVTDAIADVMSDLKADLLEVADYLRKELPMEDQAEAKITVQFKANDIRKALPHEEPKPAVEQTTPRFKSVRSTKAVLA